MSTTQRFEQLCAAVNPFEPMSLESYRDIEGDILEVWHLAKFHTVRPALITAIDKAGIGLEAIGAAKAFSRENQFRALHIAGEIARLSDALSSEDIDHLFMKGAMLGIQIFGGPERREFNDIDLLVAPAKRDRAIAIVQCHEYEPVVACPAMRRAFFDYMGQHAFKKSENGITVDLHWSLVGGCPFPIDTETILRARERLEVAGTEVPVPAIQDLGLLLAGHGQKEGWASFGWALDFAKFAASFPDFDWARAARRAQDKGALNALLTSLLLAERLFGRVLDQDLVAKARQRRRIVDDVERIVSGYHALAERRLADDLMGSFRLCDTPLQGARVWWGLLTTRTIGDYQALPLPPRWWWVYCLTRPFRLAWQRLRGQPLTPSALFEGHKKT